MTDPARCRDPEVGALRSAYELGLLGPVEQARFEEHLNHCPACLEQLYGDAPATAVLRADPAAAARRLRAVPAPARGARRRFGSSPWRLVAPVAVAGAALLLLILRPGGAPDPADLARLEALPYVKLETRQAQRAEIRAGFEEAMDAYRQGDYGAAAPMLAVLARRPGDSTEPTWAEQVALYAGVGFLLAGEPDSARAYLERSLTSRLPVLRDRSRWYLGQALLLQGEEAGARVHLRALAAGSPGYGTRARDQLRELEQRLDR